MRSLGQLLIAASMVAAASTISAAPPSGADPRADATGAGRAPGGVIVVDGLCTLADAILSANADMDVGSCRGAGGSETIVLDVDVTLVAADPSSTEVDGALAGLPDVTSELTLQAGRSALIERASTLGCAADGAGHFRLLNVLPGSLLVLDGLTLRGGCARAGGAVNVTTGAALIGTGATFLENTARGRDFVGGESGRGGAIFAASGAHELTISDSAFEGNRAKGGDGGGFQDGGFAGGGAIWLEPNQVLTITGTRFEDNEARGGSVFDAEGGEGSGGAIGGVDILGIIDDCDFVANRAIGGDSSEWLGGFAFGGAISRASQVILDSVFMENQALAGAGGSDGGFAMGGALRVPALSVLNGAIFDGNLARGGDSGSNGGGVVGGALSTASDAVVTRVVFAGNVARGGDGSSGGTASGGGASFSGTGSTITDTSFVSNLARGGDGAGSSGGEGTGGGLQATRATFVSVTLSQNVARGGNGSSGGSGGSARGGGAFLVNSVLSHGTVTANQAVAGTGEAGLGASGGGVEASGVAPPDTVTVDDSILTGNVSASGAAGPVPEDCSALFTFLLTTAGFNLVEAPGTCAFDAVGDQVGVDPLLEPLGDYGCDTPLPDGTCLPVHPVQVAGPALDQGSCNVSGATADARGETRPFDFAGTADADDGCDIGAYEVQDADGNGIDDALEIFTDGFESGDTTSWTLTVP